MTQRGVCSTAYMALLGNLVQRRGGDTLAWLRAAGLTAQDLEDPHGLVSLSAAQMLVRGAIERTADPALGVHFGRLLNLNAHGLLGFAGMVSANLEDALDIGFRYAQTRVPLLDLSLTTLHDTARIRLRFNTRLDATMHRFVLEAVVFSFATMAEHLLGPSPIGARIYTTSARPEYAELYYTLHPQPLTVHFGAADDRIEFDAALLTRALPLADHHARREAEAQLRRQLGSPRLSAASGSGLGAMIASLLSESSGYYPSFEEVAERLGTTTRTLHRRLANSGTSFRSILGGVRMREAQRLLATTGLSVTHIAHLVGFTDSSNFARAFRKWTGSSPLQWLEHAPTRDGAREDRATGVIAPRRAAKGRARRLPAQAPGARSRTGPDGA